MSRIEKVVIVVFDGLRPDMVRGRMPVLLQFLRDTLWFRNARSVFPSLTRVCTTSVSTGAWPGVHGIVNNQFHVAQDLTGPMVDTGKIADIQSLAARTGAIVTCDTLGQRLAAAGLTMTSMHSGSPGSGMLINHTVAKGGHRTFSVYGEAGTLTPDIVSRVVSACGPLPGQDVPKLDVVAYTGSVARHFALAQDQSDVTVLWLPEPDTSFHFCGIHSEGADQAMHAADTAFAEILETVAAGKHCKSTAVIAMSDHGQIATSALIDLRGDLRADGFRAGESPGDDVDILMTGGNMGELRPMSPDPGLIADLGRWLMERDSVGMVFADPQLVEGAFAPALVHQTHARSADLLYVMRSDTSDGPGGLPGLGVYTGGVPLGGGMHGGLNPYEMNTVLAISTPDGRRGEVDDAPASLTDIAPTILDLLGLEISNGGRILPLLEGDSEQPVTETLAAGAFGFDQRLTRASMAGRDYIIEGGRA